MENYNNTIKTVFLTSILALGVAVFALVFAIIAYNRTGEDLDQRIEDQVDNAIREVDMTFDQSVDSVDSGLERAEDEIDEEIEDAGEETNETLDEAGDEIDEATD